MLVQSPLISSPTNELRAVLLKLFWEVIISSHGNFDASSRIWLEQNPMIDRQSWPERNSKIHGCSPDCVDRLAEDRRGELPRHPLAQIVDMELHRVLLLQQPPTIDHHLVSS